MPALIRLYIRAIVTGFVCSAIFVALMLWVDLSGLRGVIMRSDVAVLAIVMLIVLNGLVFSAVQFAYAVMSMAERPEDRQG